jgi:transcriptional antiterminator RfaH
MAVQWYVLHSKPRKENQVHNYLVQQGIESFYPTLTVKPVNPRSSRIRAFFPRYLFVHVDLEETGASVLQWMPGAVGLIAFDGVPAIITDSFIVELKRRLARIERSGGLDLTDLRRGDKVEITSGAFAGYGAVFDVYLSGEQRVQVLMHWLGREVKVKVETDSVRKRGRR